MLAHLLYLFERFAQSSFIIGRRLNYRFLKFVDKILLKTPFGLIISPNFRAKIATNVGRHQMDDPIRLYAFWGQKHPVGNYFRAIQSSHRSQTIIEMLKPWIDPDYRLLEVGCNVGRNLNHLYKAGYRQLAGIELSRAAVERLRDAYPEIASINIDIGPAEQLLSNYNSKSFDVVFTMAVLQHIHPSGKLIFKDIGRIATKYVLAIEPRQGYASHRSYPWNIIDEFESIGLKLIDKRPWSSLWPVSPIQENEWHDSFDGYDAMLFEVPIVS